MKQTQSSYITRTNEFTRRYYSFYLYVLMALMLGCLFVAMLVYYQLKNRIPPTFTAINPAKQTLNLVDYPTPNLLPDTILRWAAKAATAAYTFQFIDVDKQINNLRPYFTEDGWEQYKAAITPVRNNLVAKQLYINSVVNGTPVIQKQDFMPNVGFVWWVQLPLLVNFQSQNDSWRGNFMVRMVIAKVPTTQSVQGMGIYQFLMRSL